LKKTAQPRGVKTAKFHLHRQGGSKKKSKLHPRILNLRSCKTVTTFRIPKGGRSKNGKWKKKQHQQPDVSRYIYPERNKKVNQVSEEKETQVSL